MDVTIDNAYIQRLAARAVEEDLGSGDVTSEAVVPKDLTCRAEIVAKQAGVLAGVPFARAAFAKVDPKVRFQAHQEDSFSIDVGTVIAVVEGSARSLLAAERVALNFLQHLSGIATLTARFVERVYGTRAKILDTRKTVPGLRLAEKYAVAAGGGVNHRVGLFDMVLIKNNHLALASGRLDGIGAAVTAARRKAGPGVQVEVEVREPEQLTAALEAKPDMILLDNMTPEQMTRAIALRDKMAPGVLLEASGKVTLTNVAAIAQSGVDRISVGALTHSAPALDIAMYLDVHPYPDHGFHKPDKK